MVKIPGEVVLEEILGAVSEANGTPGQAAVLISLAIIVVEKLKKTVTCMVAIGATETTAVVVTEMVPLATSVAVLE